MSRRYSTIRRNGKTMEAVVSDWRSSPLTRVSMPEVGDVQRPAIRSDPGFNPRPHASRAVEILALRHVELAVPEPVEHRAFVHDGEAGHMVHGFGLRNAPSRFADHQHDLAFVIELAGFARDHQRLAMRHQRQRRPHEHRWILRRVRTVLVLRVAIPVIHADAKDLGRIFDRKTETNLVEPVIGRRRGRRFSRPRGRGFPRSGGEPRERPCVR